VANPVTLAKHKTTAVYPKVRDAIGILLSQDKYDLAAAAAGAGLTLHRLKDYLSRPSVRIFMRQQRLLQIETICQQNPNALAKLRDEGTNRVAVVNGIRTLEAMRRDAIEETTGPVRREAGLVIVIGGNAGERDVRIEPPRLASAPRVIEAGAHDRRDILDEDAGELVDDEEFDALPPPVRATVRPARRK
jgi:hypothetical protein